MADAKWTYTLTLILTDWLETWRQELLIMDEQQVLYELGQAGINNYPVRRERHLFFELPGPLLPEQQAWLERGKQAGLFLDYQVSKDLTPEHMREWIQAKRKEVGDVDNAIRRGGSSTDDEIAVLLEADNETQPDVGPTY